MSLVIDIHALQSVPPSLINRDDTGAPKSAIFGGVPRQRVSSQAWKRAIREYFSKNFDPSQIGVRSKKLPEKIALLLEERGVEQGDAIARTDQLFKAAGIKTVVDKKAAEKVATQVKEEKKGGGKVDDSSLYPQAKALIFLSPWQIENAVETLLEKDGERVKKREAQEILNENHSVDISAFGRMVAGAPDYNVDAAVQVAHALGVHGSAPEFDFFTAVDDLADEGGETGAGMIGTTQMMSSTLYRYATVDLGGLSENLGSTRVAKEAAVQFLEAFISSMPTGKISSFANQVLPELVYVAIRDTRPVSLVNAFETPVIVGASGNGCRETAAEILAQEAEDVENVYGFKPLRSFVMGLGQLTEPFTELAESVSLPELKDRLSVALGGLLGDE